MGYDVHITRRRIWWQEGDGITLEEWRSCVASDPEMRLDGYAEALVDGGTLRLENESLAVWTAYPLERAPGDRVWFMLQDGNVVVKNPDEAILIKMATIALALGGRVQGDEGEIYGDDGRRIGAESPDDEPAPETADATTPAVAATGGKRWWDFWK